MVRNSAPPLALLLRGKNGSTLQGGTVLAPLFFSVYVSLLTHLCLAVPAEGGKFMCESCGQCPVHQTKITPNLEVHMGRT